MALSVSRATVKEKCRIAVTDFDTEIDDLIAEQLPVVEFSILEKHIADTGNTNLQKALNLGAAEVIAGEFLAQSFREPGAAEQLVVGEVTFGSRLPQRASLIDPFGLKSQGLQRLAPFMTPVLPNEDATRTDVRYSTPKLTDEEVDKW